jgi:hypothetical protein
VKVKSTDRIESVQLSNGLYIPVAPMSEIPATLNLPQGIVEVDEMEWSINKRIVIESDTGPDQRNEIAELKLKEFNESFEYLRITFSNYLNSHEEGGNFRNELEEVIFSRDYPLYEKRRRLEIKIGSIVEGWIAERDEDKPRQVSILRKDCTLLAEKDCTGMCSWKSEGAAKCLIHVSKPSTTTIDGRVSAPGGTILLRRLIEELLRFGARRKQIFEQRVSEITELTGAIREKDQYIIPERSYTWTEMLRNDWTKVGADEPVFLEEMTEEPSDNPVPAPVTELTKIPDALATILNPNGDDPIFERLRLYPSPGGILPLLAILNVNVPTEGLTKLDMKVMSTLIRESHVFIIQINLQETNPSKRVMAIRFPNDTLQKYAIFVIQEDGSPAIIVTDPETPMLLRSSELTAEMKRILNDKTVTKTVWPIAR